MSNNFKGILKYALIFTSGLSAGIMLAYPVLISLNPPKQTPAQKITKNPVFKSQLGIFTGTITAINGKTMSLKSGQGESGNFDLAPGYIIYKKTPNKTTETAGSDLTTIKPPQQASIQLELLNGQYLITSVVLLPEPKNNK